MPNQGTLFVSVLFPHIIAVIRNLFDLNQVPDQVRWVSVEYIRDGMQVKAVNYVSTR